LDSGIRETFLFPDYNKIDSIEGLDVSLEVAEEIFVSIYVSTFFEGLIFTP